tara:strand:- start:1083 stop:1289 length:207 start_codon:yes stop_codon:yes gene_type:complete
MKYYAYDHSNEDRLEFKDFGVFMYWIDKHYDKERHSVFDTKASLKECCKQNDNPIYDNHVTVENLRSI